jgi:GT2 family glycosyltransferase/Tfp pilus assembly protein PilF
LKFTNYPYEIIFVDNASTDGTPEYLRELVEQNENFRLIENKTNKGFAGGNNQGVSVAKGTYVMLLNNDVLVSENWLTQLVNSLEICEKIGVVGPVTNHISGRQSYVGHYEGDNYLEFADFIKKENKGKLTPRRRLAGFAMLLRKDVFNSINGFDETFGVGNFEDDDFSLKIKSKGLALMVDESVFIHHYGSQTFKANDIDILENLKERLPIFQKKWPQVDYEELLEIKHPLDDQHNHLLSSGINDLEQSNFTNAETKFLKILMDNPISEEALYGMVLCYRNHGDIDHATTYVNQLLEINPFHAEGLNQKGLIWVNEGKYEEAKHFFMMAMKYSPNFIDPQRNLAELYILNEKFEKGVQTYLTILQNHPEDIASLLRMAELNREADNNEEASEWAKLVLNLEPEHPVASQFIY